MSSELPQLTVVTIGRDFLAGLKTTRASVAAQSYSNLQHLLIDGASSDGSLEFLATLPSDRVRWKSEPDGGIYHALNKALDLVDGGYLIFLHAGDSFVDEGAAERAMQAIADAPTPPDLAIGWSRFVTRSGDDLPYIVGAATPNALTSAHESTIFSHALHKTLPYNTDLQLAADYELFRRLAERTDLAVLRLPFTVSNFAFGGRSNDPKFDGKRFLERARVNESFGDSPSMFTYVKIAARMGTRRIAYRLLGDDRAAAAFLRLACRRGNSGARALPVGQVRVEPSAG